MTHVAIIGASANRSKFGNKAVRAYKQKGFTVFPVNPKEKIIEGLKCYKSIIDISDKIDIVTIYLQPSVSRAILCDIIEKKPLLVYLNPGSENKELEKKLVAKGITVREECSIASLGLSPEMFSSD